LKSKSTLSETLKSIIRTSQQVEKPEELAAVTRAIQELIASRRAARALKAGAVAPEFQLKDDVGQNVSSADLLKQGPLVLTFYWGSWSAICHAELHALQDALPHIRASGANIVGVSQNSSADAQEMRRMTGLTFPLLSDPHGMLSDDFGLRWAIPEYLRLVFAARGVRLPDINGDDSWTLPIPARYIVGTDGIVSYSEINPDHRIRPEPNDLLPTLKRLARNADSSR
jgi:peroxiredoxin